MSCGPVPPPAPFVSCCVEAQPSAVAEGEEAVAGVPCSQEAVGGGGLPPAVHH